jgi:hypothetical protein
MSATTLTLRITALAWIVSGLGYVALPPFYEEGSAKFYVPILGSIDFIIAYALLKDMAWIKRWALAISVGTLVVAIAFYGGSSTSHGAFTIPMLISESAAIVAALGLLALSFTSAFSQKEVGSA